MSGPVYVDEGMPTDHPKLYDMFEIIAKADELRLLEKESHFLIGLQNGLQFICTHVTKKGPCLELHNAEQYPPINGHFHLKRGDIEVRFKAVVMAAELEVE